ncbi:MAG: heavy metal translocating P-type ATPase [Eubacterium sp.]|nr:heavy metal translocating P-type ATPase [Eubacterium sp.]
MDQYTVTGMSCAACQARVEKAVSCVEGVESVSVSLLTNSMGVSGNVSADKIIKAVEEAGYGAAKKGAQGGGLTASEKLAQEEEALKDKETPKLVRRLALSVGFLILLMYITMGHNMLGAPLPAFLIHNHIGLAILQMLIAIVVMLINSAFFKSGFKTLAHRSPNMDTLVAMGSSVSFAWSLYVLFEMTYLITIGTDNMELTELYHNQLYFESAAMIPALITVGKTLESLSKGRTTDALKNLMKMAPKTAVVEKNGELVEVGIDDVEIGDIFAVKPGEAIPVDGIITEGITAIDESALTGESVPVDKEAGDKVSAATINTSGFIKARATRVGEDTTFSQIIQMISDAAATKAPIARIADRVSGIFVPSVLLIALVVTLIWLFIGATPADALERGIAVLVVSCPCALGLATPVAIMVGNGMGAKGGILFKTSESLENAGRVQIIALDKTGTITAGTPEVTDIIPTGDAQEDELLKLAYSLEVKSEHPLAKAVVRAAEEKNISAIEVSGFSAIAGNGLKGKAGDDNICGGSMKFISSLTKISDELTEKANRLADEGKTPLFFMKNDEPLGIIAVADTIKESSARAVKELKNMGIEVIMLTGDNEKTANAIGKAAGVDKVIAGVLPEGKQNVINKLKKRGKVAMVGDGINDAPALMSADIGIAIGAGTDVAIDSADVVLMNSKLTDASAAIRLSRATLRDIHQNLFWAFAYNALLIPMAAGAYPGIKMNPMWGAAAMAISSFTVCMNALRLNLFKIHDASSDKPLKNKALPEPEGETYTEETNLSKEEGLMTKTVKIEGMMCGHCEATVKKALEGMAGIESAEVSHEKGTAVISLSADVADDDIKNVIADKDFTVTEITA